MKFHAHKIIDRKNVFKISTFTLHNIKNSTITVNSNILALWGFGISNNMLIKKPIA
jgi:hypothetical protein